MRFVVGGAYQGKLTFACSLLRREEARDIYADGREDGEELAFERPIVYCFEEYVRRFLEEGRTEEQIGEFVEELLARQPELIVVATEIGCGIVPTSPFWREYRDIDGRLCQKLAGRAREVYRVVCGIGMRIK